MAQSSGAFARHARGVWRRLFERSGLVRHPVSVMRRRLGNALLAVLVLMFGFYTYRTRDEAIRQGAIRFFERITPGGVEIAIGSASFKMFDGVTLRHVRISVPYDERLDPSAVSAESRKLFSAESLKLSHNPWHLLLGNLRVERIVAVGPTIHLVYNPDTGMRNWQLLASNQRAVPVLQPRYRPIVTLRGARVNLSRIDEGDRQESASEELDADLRPHPQSETGYYIEVRRYGNPIERTTMLFDPTERIVANTPFVNAETIRLQLPKPMQELFDKLSLAGEVRLSRLLYDAASPEQRETAIELRRVQCDIPVSLLTLDFPDDRSRDSADGPVFDRDDESMIHLVGVEGELNFHGERLDLNVSGMFNGAACRLTGTFDPIDRELKNVGVRLHILGTGVPTLEGGIRERLLADADIPRGLRRFFEDYDPHGTFDLDLTFTRDAGAPGTMRMLGTIRPVGVSGKTRWFPYPLTDAYGLVRFKEERVSLESFHGRHGSGAIRLDGQIDRRTKKPGIDLDIRATSVPLDEDLRSALPDRYQGVWERFRPEGRVHINARLRRPGYEIGAPKPSWEQSIAVELVEATAKLSPYPHPIDHLRGRLEVVGDRIRIDNLAGDCAGASVRFDGSAVLEAGAPARVRLDVQAIGLRLDASLGAALPPEGRGAFAQFQPSGRVDLSGTLMTGGEDSALVWDMRALVSEADVCYEHFPYSISDVSGEILLRPDRISLLNVHGRHGQAEISAGGEVRRHSNGFEAHLNLDAGEVALDQELFAALPPPLKAVWRLLEPEGRATIRTDLYIDSTDGRNLRRHRTDIRPIDAHLRLRDLPIPLSSMNGRVLATQRRVEIQHLSGRIGGGSIEIHGEIDQTEPGKRGTLAIHASGLSVDDALRAALPEALRGLVRSVNPRGPLEIRLDPIRFEIDDAGRTRWDFDGTLQLRDARLRLGFEIGQCHGVLSFRGSVDEAGRLTLDAKAEIERAVMAGWHVEHVQAHITKAADAGKILIEDARGDLYDGEATAFGEVELGRGQSRYQASFTVRDIQLSRYLSVHQKKDGPPPRERERRETARGVVSGNFMLRGRTGVGGTREGAGEVFVSDAQIWKLPIIFAIFQVLNLAPDENVFHDGRMRFFLSGETLTFQKIDLQGKAMSFVGGGRMDLRSDQMDVTLLAGSPMRIRIPLLTDLLEGASREMMEIRVRGTLEKPDIQPQPLKSLTAALKTLFPEPPRTLKGRSGVGKNH